MANPLAGEVDIVMDGVSYRCKLTLGAMAEMEATMGSESMVDLVARFEAGKFSSRDVMALVVAGLRGGGWAGTTADLLKADIEGGAIGAAKAAALLLVRAFTPPK